MTPKDLLQRGQWVLIAGLSALIVLLIVAVVVFNRQSKANAQLAKQNAEIANTAQAASTFAITQQAAAQANAEEAQRQATISRGQVLAISSQLVSAKNQLSLLLGIEAFNDCGQSPLLRTVTARTGSTRCIEPGWWHTPKRALRHD